MKYTTNGERFRRAMFDFIGAIIIIGIGVILMLAYFDVLTK